MFTIGPPFEGRISILETLPIELKETKIKRLTKTKTHVQRVYAAEWCCRRTRSQLE